VVSTVATPPTGDPPGELPTQPTLRRLRAFGVRPKRDLGQNFLIDSNILGVIARAAALEPADVVL
jgi:16S rRNA (adenine1518-N6/adenine1519-N6)-dimethyltransferase